MLNIPIGKFGWIKDGQNELNYRFGSIHYKENGIEKQIYIDTSKNMSKLRFQNEDVVEFSIPDNDQINTWYGSKGIQTIYNVKIINGTINRKNPTRVELSNRHRRRYIYKFNEKINQFEEFVFIGEINRKDLLDSTSVFLIINFESHAID